LSYPIEDPNSSPQDVIPFPSGTTQRRIRFTPGTLRREPRRGSTSPSREKPKARPKPKPRKSRGKGKGKAKEEDSDEEEVQDGSDEEEEPTEKKRRGGRRTAMTDRDRIKMAGDYLKSSIILDVFINLLNFTISSLSLFSNSSIPSSQNPSSFTSIPSSSFQIKGSSG